jgi:signal transduction histidine kinase
MFRLASPASAMRYTPIDLDVLLLDVADTCHLEARAAGKTVRLTDLQSAVVCGDPLLLAACFERVVRNAIRRTRFDTCIEIALACQRPPASYCCTTVRDYGEHLEELQLHRLFDAASRVDPEASHCYSRSRSELAATKALVLQHGGSISASNARDSGLVVNILLPCDRGSR